METIEEQDASAAGDLGPMATLAEEPSSPIDWALRTDRLPHIWCPGCGIGTAVVAFVEAVKEAGVEMDNLSVVSGIGCTGRVAGYLDCDSFHTTHGRAIPFATGLHVANPNLKVVVFSGDGDLTAIGGNHLIHAARRNVDITVICVNNFVYGMTGGQGGPTTQTGAKTSTTPFGNLDEPFNLAKLLVGAGATYVSRWTVLDLSRLRRSMVEALNHKGFSFVEVVSPCPVYYGRRNRLGEAVDELRYYREHTIVEPSSPLEEAGIGELGGDIKVGKFLETELPTLEERLAGLAARESSNGLAAPALEEEQPNG